VKRLVSISTETVTVMASEAATTAGAWDFEREPACKALRWSAIFQSCIDKQMGARMTRSFSCAIVIILLVADPYTLAGPLEGRDLKVVVPGVHAYAGVPAGSADVLSDLLLNALLARHGVHAMGPADVRAMLTAEQQKNLLGCSDESCMAELAGALGADWLIGGSVGRLEDLYVLSLQLIDARKARVTARASVNLKSLKDATGKIGPLVDKLLDARPRHKVEPSILKQAPAEKHKSLDRPAFCKLNQEYVRLLGKAPYDPKLVTLRRKILLDLVLTPFQREFDNKRTCIWEPQGRTSNALRVRLNMSTDRGHAHDAKRNLAEYATFIQQVKIIQDEYVRALKMEENGTGKRLAGPPFDVKEVPARVQEESEEIRAYRNAYQAAGKVLSRVLAAASKNRKKSLRAFFSSKDPKHSRDMSERAFTELRTLLKRGYRLRICPLDVRPYSEIERAARRFGEKHIVECWWLRAKKGSASLDRAWMIKHKDNWKIDRW